MEMTEAQAAEWTRLWLHYTAMGHTFEFAARMAGRACMRGDN